MNPDLMNLMQALAQVESSGNYKSLGPRTKSGDRAYGKYQVMGANIPEWTKAALGTSMDPQTFLNDPKAQDAVAQHKLGSYLDQYGNPGDAASMWFSGQPLSKGANRSDGYLTGNQYVQKVLAGMGQGGQPAPAPTVADTAFDNGDGEQLPANATPTQYQGQQSKGIEFNPAGIPDALSGLGAGLVTAVNPAAGAALMAQVNAKQLRQQALNRPTFGVIGEKTDALGQTHKIYGWVNPNNQTATPLNGGAVGSGGGADASDISAVTQNIRDIRANGGSTQDALKAVDPSVAPYVQALVEGRALPGNMGRGQARLRLMAIAHEVDPTLDEQTYALRTQFAKNMGMSSPQSYGGQVNSANTIVAHLDSAMQQLPVLEKGMLGMTDVLSSGNNAKAYARDQMGDKEYKAASGRWNVATKGIADELEKLLAGSNGAEASKQYWLKQFDLNRGPTAVAASLDEARALMMGRLGSIAHQKETAYGTPSRAEDLLSPDARAAVPRITGGASDRLAAPQGATQTKVIGGKQYHLINGQWMQE